MKKKKAKKHFPFFTWMIAMVIILVAAVNTIPGFVSKTKDVPVLGRLIEAVEFQEVLNTDQLHDDPLTSASAESGNFSVMGNLVKDFSFEDGIATGGTITDNVNVKSISVTKDNGIEHIGIGFTQRGETEQPQLAAPYFEIAYDENPYTMTFTFHGARAFDANDFADLKKSDLVEDAYWLVTHDDSAIQFVIVFNGPVLMEGKEYADPAELVVTVSEDMHANDEKLYAVRTPSHLFGGEIPYYEEYLFEETGLRVLRENGILFSTWESEFFLEVGLFERKEEAEQKAKEINEKYGPEIHVFVDERVKFYE
ncbi:hypothetical protein SLU01_08380 [Sporosarcina luteola]|uniref:Uncharacterized protein n=1 Tax=Sporosarcina luteola TaxID=582850 RepID=A0A511Z507_9BACL|nr:hypothetical protein [Sporosarcina luteola]GEN82526.1 hypothetical protein SLU01_08380 [Sporosarcina luteola]